MGIKCIRWVIFTSYIQLLLYFSEEIKAENHKLLQDLKVCELYTSRTAGDHLNYFHQETDARERESLLKERKKSYNYIH